MMLDAPSYDFDDEEDEVVITERNRNSIIDYVNGLM